MDFHTCCGEDNCRRAATHPQLWILKKELKMPYTAPELKCEICNKELNELEMQGLKSNHVNLTCVIHRRAAMEYNLEITKQKYGYSEKYIILNTILNTWGY